MNYSEQELPRDEGYYFSAERGQIIQAGREDTLPDAEDWEYIGATNELTPADAVAAVEERYPDLSVELEFHKV